MGASRGPDHAAGGQRGEAPVVAPEVSRSPLARRSWGHGLLALAGALAWACWWAAALPPEQAFALWAATILLWAGSFYSRITVSSGTSLTIAVSLIVGALVALRFVALSTMPYRIETDEVFHPLFGLEVLRGAPWTVFGGVSHYYNTPYLTHVLQALPCLVLPPLLGARVASVMLALASLVSTYALAGRLFGRNVACAATVLLAASFWHVVYSRTGYPYMQAIAVVPMALYALTRGVVERHRLLQFLGGLLLGCSLLVYTSARVVIPVFAVWFAWRLAQTPRQWREATKSITVIGVGAALMLSPYAGNRGMTGVLFDRYQQTTLTSEAPLARLTTLGWASAQGVELLWAQVRAAARVYHAPGAWLAVHSPAPSGLLDPVTLSLAVLGLGIAIAGIRKPAYLLLVVWVAATFTFGQVLTDVPHAAYRAAPALPALAICGGVAMAWFARRLPSARRPLHAGVQALALIGFAVALMLMNAPALRAYFDARTVDPVGSLARFVAAGPRAATYHVLGPEPFATEPIPLFVGAGQTVHDVYSLEDTLQVGLSASRGTIFLIHFEMRGAAAIIQSCYPEATIVGDAEGEGPNSVLALLVPPSVDTIERRCELHSAASGLLARYFRSADWSGPVELERVERWPMRWGRSNHHEPFSSVEWIGSLRIPAAGEYRFQLVNLNDAVGMAKVGDAIALDSAQPRAETTLEPGNLPLRLQCRLGAAQICWLRVARPGSDFESLPPDWLSPAYAKETADGAMSGVAQIGSLSP